MKKFAGLAAVGIGSIVAVAAAPSQAAFTTHISGNFQYTSMQYWCDKGTPNFAFSYRTLNKTESKVTFTAAGFSPRVSTNVSPYTASQTIYAIGGYPGKAVTVTGKGATTGSAFSVSGKVPATCAGLPSTMPEMNWAGAGKPTAQPVPTKTTPAPTKTTPAPTKTTPAPTKTTPAPTKTTPAPTMPAPTTGAPTGPKVETDRVATSNDSTTFAAAGLAAVAAVAGGGVAVARRSRR